MRMAGLEPAHSHLWQILSLLRLPFRHIRNNAYINIWMSLFQYPLLLAPVIHFVIRIAKTTIFRYYRKGGFLGVFP